MKNTIAVTGHRPNKLGGYNAEDNFRAIRRHMKDLLTELAPSRIISGGALGIDQFWMEVGIYLGIPVIGALPFEGYDARWPKASREKYRGLLDKCEEVRYIGLVGYDPAKLQKRNEWMVDNSDLLVAYWDGSTGGTANCVDYAKKIQRDIKAYDIWDVIEMK